MYLSRYNSMLGNRESSGRILDILEIFEEAQAGAFWRPHAGILARDSFQVRRLFSESAENRRLSEISDLELKSECVRLEQISYRRNTEREKRLRRGSLSLAQLRQGLPSKSECEEFLEAMRWPHGFSCPLCMATGQPYRFPNRSSTVLRCRRCHANTSLTAGTFMQKTTLGLPVWFLGARLVTAFGSMVSVARFQSELRLNRYETAAAVLSKLLAHPREAEQMASLSTLPDVVPDDQPDQKSGPDRLQTSLRLARAGIRA